MNVVQAPIMQEGLLITVAPTVSGLAPSYTIQHMEGETNVTTGAATYVALCPRYDRMLRHSMRDVPYLGKERKTYGLKLNMR